MKPELKAMTSAAIVFTVFVLGGYTFYMMEYMGMAPQQQQQHGIDEQPLLKRKVTQQQSFDQQDSMRQRAARHEQQNHKD